MGFHIHFSGKSNTKNAAGFGCLFIFGAVFFVVGLSIGVFGLRSVFQSYQARSWRETPMTIVETDLEESTDSEGTTTWEATARYRYTWQGESYESTRVSFDSGADNLGSWQKGTYRELKRRLETGEPYMGRVDPDEPSQAVLIPKPRIGKTLFMVGFSVVFGGVGLGILMLGVFGRRKSKRRAELEGQHPKEPWLANEDWAEGRIVDSTKGGMIFLIIFTVLWNAISFPVVFLAGSDLQKEEGALIYLLYLFPAIGVIMILICAYQIARFLKYRRSVFEMSSVPGVIGGPLAGIIYTKRNIIPEDGFHLTLSCIRRYVSGSGDNRSTRESVLWQDERVMEHEALEHDLTRSAIPVLFAVPYDQKETDDSDPSDKILWRLEVKAKTRGIDYTAKFEAPVFKTEESLEDFELDESAIAQYARPADAASDISGLGARRVETADGSIYTFPPARHLGMAFGLTVFFAIWSGAIYLMWSLGAPFFFTLIFGLIDIVLLYGMLHVWLFTSRVETARGRMKVASGMLVPASSSEFAADDIKDIDLHQSMTSGSKVFYSLQARLGSGKKVLLARYIDNRRMGKTLIDEIQREIQGQ